MFMAVNSAGERSVNGSIWGRNVWEAFEFFPV